ISKQHNRISVPKEPSKTKREDCIEDLTLFSDEYSFWEWDEKANIVVYFQNKLDRPIYYNQNGLLLLYLNDENEVAYYTQTVLGAPEKSNDNRKLIKQMREIETLYEEKTLNRNDEICFHTRVPLDSGVQVFAPTWNIEVNGQSHYFVNAIEEFIFSSQHQEFLKDTLINIEAKASLIKKEEIKKEEFIQELGRKNDF